jgi:DNA invertase Pin-like site-specific DNA recombinase
MNERQLALDLSPRRKGVAYLRTSTTKQKLSIETQRAQIEKWASAEGIGIVSWHEDVGVSGAKRMNSRRGMIEALSFLSATGSQFLIVTHRDRLARGMDVASEIDAEVERMGASVVCAETHDVAAANADLMQNMIDAFSAYERATTSKRTASALAVKRERGEKLGGSCPIGTATTDGVQLVPDAGEAVAVARILELRAAGVSLVKIAARLDAEGHRPRGARWHATSIVNVLKRNG